MDVLSSHPPLEGEATPQNCEQNCCERAAFAATKLKTETAPRKLRRLRWDKFMHYLIPATGVEAGVAAPNVFAVSEAFSAVGKEPNARLRDEASLKAPPDMVTPNTGTAVLMLSIVGVPLSISAR